MKRWNRLLTRTDLVQFDFIHQKEDVFILGPVGTGKTHVAKAIQNYIIARGGSFTRYLDLARCRRRHGYFPKSIYILGFRLAEDTEH